MKCTRNIPRRWNRQNPYTQAYTNNGQRDIIYILSPSICSGWITVFGWVDDKTNATSKLSEILMSFKLLRRNSQTTTAWPQGGERNGGCETAGKKPMRADKSLLQKTGWGRQCKLRSGNGMQTSRRMVINWGSRNNKCIYKSLYFKNGGGGGEWRRS